MGAQDDILFSVSGATHWGQQVFYLQPPLECAPSDSIIASIEVTRKPENHRLLRVNMLVKVRVVATGGASRVSKSFVAHEDSSA